MIIKIILLGLCVCIINIVLKDTQRAFILLTNICYVVIVAWILLDYTAEFISKINDLFSITSSSGKMFTCLFKGAMICVLTKISADICKESGNIVISDIVDIAGRVMLLIIAIPFVESIVKTATAFIL